MPELSTYEHANALIDRIAGGWSASGKLTAAGGIVASASRWRVARPEPGERAAGDRAAAFCTAVVVGSTVLLARRPDPAAPGRFPVSVLPVRH